MCFNLAILLVILSALSFLLNLFELKRRKRLVINKVFFQPWLQVEEFLHEY